MPRHELVLYRKDGEIVRISDAIDPMTGRPRHVISPADFTWPRPLVIEAEWEPVPELVPEPKGEHDEAIHTIAWLVVITTPFAALLHLACVKGWIYRHHIMKQHLSIRFQSDPLVLRSEKSSMYLWVHLRFFQAAGRRDSSLESGV